MSGNLDRGLAKVEQQLAEKAKERELAKCTCPIMMCASDPEEFRAEMDRTCPVHQFRDLGHIFAVLTSFEGADGTPQNDTRLEELLNTYDSRRSRYRRSLLGPEYASQKR
jgi:hypothetical protein